MASTPRGVRAPLRSDLAARFALSVAADLLFVLQLMLVLACWLQPLGIVWATREWLRVADPALSLAIVLSALVVSLLLTFRAARAVEELQLRMRRRLRRQRQASFETMIIATSTLVIGGFAVWFLLVGGAAPVIAPR